MKKISAQELTQLCQNTTVLQPNKVYLTQDNIIVKIIYDRNLISSSNLYPYALRIKNNSRHLLAKGITTVNVQEILYCSEKRVSVVIYPELEGVDCRKEAASNNLDLLNNLAKYVASLHKLGVFFWDLHLGNILYQDANKFSLIDIATVKITRRKLGALKRARNISHLVAYKFDQETFQNYGIKKFVEIYLAESKIQESTKKLFLYHLQRRLRKKMKTGSIVQ